MDGIGYKYKAGSGGGGGRNFVVNQVSVQEVSLQTDGNSAEVETGGVQMNVVPREGGNTFKVYGISAYSSGDLEANNITEELKNRGFATAAPLQKIWDNGLGVGGPVNRDKLWFYIGLRAWGASQGRGGLGAYANATQSSWFYSPDLSK